jgi:hypothetical protein
MTVTFWLAVFAAAVAANPSKAAVYNDMKPGMAEAHTLVYAVKPKLWNGTPSNPVVSGCTKNNWMTSTCAYSVEVTPVSGGPRQICRGSVSVTRHQQLFVFKVPRGGAAVCSPLATIAGVKPVGLLLGDAKTAAIAAVRQMSFVGSPGTPTSSCTRASWMAARCAWSVNVTAETGDRFQTCSGTLSVVRQQVKGYPLTVNRVGGTKVKCVASSVPV